MVRGKLEGRGESTRARDTRVNEAGILEDLIET